MISKYKKDRDNQVLKNINSKYLASATNIFTKELININYVKNFTWMGIPIIQYPTDMMVMQEVIFDVKPHILIETGMAFGGTAIFYSSVMQHLRHPWKVISIDIEMKVKNWERMRSHSASENLVLVQGDSASATVASEVAEIINNFKRQKHVNNPTVMVALDSNHTYDHVLKELNLYAPLVSIGSYIVVFDTAIELFMKEKPSDRPWGPGNNPWTAVQAFLKQNKNFKPDKSVETRALITAAPDGWLRRII